MRVGVDLRFLAAGREVVRRGVGRFALQQLREVLRADRDGSYVLIVPGAGEMAALSPALAIAAHAEVVSLPPALAAAGPGAERSELYALYAADLRRFVSALDLDLLHVPVPDLAGLAPAVAFDSTPVVVNHYDLIPDVYPDRYLVDPIRREQYRRALEVERGCDRWIAISKFSKYEAVERLGLSAERVDVAYPAAEAVFGPRSPAAIQAALADLRRRCPLPERFILAVSHLHYAKNLRRLLADHADLPAALRAVYPLVLVADFSPPELATLKDWLGARPGAEHVVATGPVGDDELAALYNAAALLVHPSLHEGFGLPVIEAMQCGTPVIAAAAAALPELVGDAAELVDPSLAGAFAGAIERLLGDDARRAELGRRGLERAKKFTLAALGESTLDAFRRTVGSRLPGRRERLRVAMWTPLPPRASGIAEYSVELVQATRSWCDVELFIDDGYVPRAPGIEPRQVHHADEFERVASRQPFDAVLFQLGASSHHAYMQKPLERWPGAVAVLHDLTWSHLLFEQHLANGSVYEFRRRLAASEGEPVRAQFDALGSWRDPRFFPRLEELLEGRFMLEPILASTLTQVVHWPHAVADLEGRYPEARVSYFGMGVADPLAVAEPSRSGARDRLGFQADEFVVAILGAVDPVKRLPAILAAARALRDRGNPISLVIAGGYEPSYGVALRRAIAEAALGRHVRLLGRVDAQVFGDVLRGADVLVNLRFPFRRQMSATLLRGIAAGLPVVITDLPAWSFLPETFCWRVAADDGEVARLTELLQRLASGPELRLAMGSAAREWYLEHATLERMGHEYRSLLHGVAGRAEVFSARKEMR